MKAYKVDKLLVEIYENRTLMGQAAARDIKAKIARLLCEKSEINMIFAAAPSKAQAVYETLNGSVDEHCPASILRTHDNAKLYLDNESSKLLCLR